MPRAKGGRKSRKNNKQHNAKDLAALKAKIDAQGEKIRQMKGKFTPTEIKVEAFNLLALKYLHPEHRHWCYQPGLDPARLPPKVIKIRWRLVNGDGTTTRLQRPFKNVTSLSGAEVIAAISEETKKKAPALSGFLKIEYTVGIDEEEAPAEDEPSTSAAGATGAAAAAAAGAAAPAPRPQRQRTTRKYVALREDDQFRLPMVNPGPRLADVKAFEFRVTFVPAVPSPSCTPPSYVGLPVLPRLVDAGVNLFSENFKKDKGAVIDRSFSAGVTDMLLISTTVANSVTNVELSERHGRSLYTLAGVHPCEAYVSQPDPHPPKLEEATKTTQPTAPKPKLTMQERREARLKAKNERLAKKAAKAAGGSAEAAPSKPVETVAVPADIPPAAAPAAPAAAETPAAPAGPVPQTPEERDRLLGHLRTLIKEQLERPAHLPNLLAGLGEIGLDYEHSIHSTRPVHEEISAEEKAAQMWWFERQLELAVEFKLPVLLHERKAHADFLAVLKNWRSRLGVCVINCFSGSSDELTAYLALDCYIVITGLVCDVKRGTHLVPLAASIPADRLILGSDAPHLVPYAMPRPFPRRNEPAFMVWVAHVVASARGMNVDALARQTTENCVRAFSRMSLGSFDGVLPEGLIKVNPNAGGEETEALPALDTLEGDALISRLTAMGYPPPANDGTYIAHNGVVYKVTKREMSVLSKQRASLPAEAFHTLITDFQLEAVPLGARA